MRAMAIEHFGGADRLKSMDLPRPRPGRGEVLIRVVAAGVNPVDVAIREGKLQEQMPHALPLIPGWDAAGVIEEFGEGSSGFRKGDRVWALARKPVVQWGCYAEYVVVPDRGVAMMPSKLLFEEAAAVPTAGLAAEQALFGQLRIEAGDAVLIHAAAGGVGHLAVQLARAAGANVVGTASTEHASFVLGLGATVVIDHTKEDFADAVRRHHPDGVDAVLDAVGGEVLTRSYDVLRPGGRLVSLVDLPDAELSRRHEVAASRLDVTPDSEQLGKLSRMVDQKKLRPHVEKIYALGDAREAQRHIAGGHVAGKLVLNL